MAHAQRRLQRETLEMQAKVVRQAIRLIVEKGPEAAGELRKLMASVREMPQLEAPERRSFRRGCARSGSIGGVRKRKRTRPG